MSLFCCPLCGRALERGGSAYRCPLGHSYDLAKEGYTYLLPVNQKHSAAPGDDKGMAAARRAFLSKDYYRPLLDALCQLAISHTGNHSTLLDSGCGEGYYTAGICTALQAAGKAPRMAGIDISKFSLRAAAKRAKGIEFAVASSYHLPVADASIDLLLNCFSPLAPEEFGRVLRPGGAFLYVIPAAKHLWELKEVLYDQPYPNAEREIPYGGFVLEASVPVEGTLTLNSATDIHNLFQMTPYYWKTPPAGVERLKKLEQLTVGMAFRVLVFRKNAPASRE